MRNVIAMLVMAAVAGAATPETTAQMLEPAWNNQTPQASPRVLQVLESPQILSACSDDTGVQKDPANSIAAPPSTAYEPTHVDVFTSGLDGYPTYRIPSLVVAPDGSLIAIAEARTGDDPGFGGYIDLVYKRSTDNGLTWSPMQMLDSYPDVDGSSSNPTTVVDGDMIWVLYNRWEPGYGTGNSLPGTMNNQSWGRFSIDNGLTWSTAIDITTQARDYDNWRCSVFGPGGGIVDSNGRILIPTYMHTTDTISSPYALYSDNHGVTWQRGALLATVSANENQFVELSDGSILMDARPYPAPNRWLSTSSDGGETWAPPSAGQVVPNVMASIARYTLESAGDDCNRILWTAPKGPARSNLVVRVSYDEGQTFVNEHLIASGPAAYSHVAILQDQSIGVFWERAGYQHLTFSRFDLGFLEPVWGDLNGDGYVGQTDLDIVLADWGHSPPTDPRADPSGDGFVGQVDLSVVLDWWGTGTMLSRPIPEPAVLSLLALGALAVIRRRR